MGKPWHHVRCLAILYRSDEVTQIFAKLQNKDDEDGEDEDDQDDKHQMIVMTDWKLIL